MRYIFALFSSHFYIIVMCEKMFEEFPVSSHTTDRDLNSLFLCSPVLGRFACMFWDIVMFEGSCWPGLAMAKHSLIMTLSPLCFAVGMWFFLSSKSL